MLQIIIGNARIRLYFLPVPARMLVQRDDEVVEGLAFWADLAEIDPRTG